MLFWRCAQVGTFCFVLEVERARWKRLDSRPRTLYATGLGLRGGAARCRFRNFVHILNKFLCCKKCSKKVLSARTPLERAGVLRCAYHSLRHSARVSRVRDRRPDGRRPRLRSAHACRDRGRGRGGGGGGSTSGGGGGGSGVCGRCGRSCGGGGSGGGGSR